MSSRVYVTAFRAERSGPLEQHLPREQDERACDVEPVGEERAVAGVRSLLCLHAADGQDHLLGLARKEVPAARAAVDEEADARGAIALDARAVGGSRARHEHAALLVDPAKRRDVVV